MLRELIKFLIKLLWWWVCGYRAVLIWAVYAAHDALHSVFCRNIPRCPAEFVSDHKYWATVNLAAAESIRFIHRQRQALKIAWPDDATPSSKPSVVPVMSLPPGVRLIIWEYAFESYPENRAMVLAACSSRGDDTKYLDSPDTYHILRRWNNPMIENQLRDPGVCNEPIREGVCSTSGPALGICLSARGTDGNQKAKGTPPVRPRHIRPSVARMRCRP